MQNLVSLSLSLRLEAIASRLEAIALRFLLVLSELVKQRTLKRSWEISSRVTLTVTLTERSFIGDWGAVGVRGVVSVSLGVTLCSSGVPLPNLLSHEYLSVSVRPLECI